MIINVSFDQSDAALPFGFKAAINAAVSFLESTFIDPITLAFRIGFGEVAGHALSGGAIAQSSFSVRTFSYSQIRAALAADATSSDDFASVATIPVSDPLGGPYVLTQAEAKALGLGGFGSTFDGSVGFSDTAFFDYDNSNGVAPGAFDFFGVALHEMTEVMGRIFGNNDFLPLELFHYSAPNTRDVFGTTPGYFSIDNGFTNLGNFNTDPSGDFNDWANSVGLDPFRAFAPSGQVLPVTARDLLAMDVIGYDLASVQPSHPDNFYTAADFNNDGKVDMLWQNVSGQAADWLIDGTSFLGANLIQANPGASWVVKGSGDFNGDGRSDVLWQNTDGTPAIWLLNGSNRIASGIPHGNPGSSWSVVGSADFDADGKSDIIWQNDDGTPAIWLMNGTSFVVGGVPHGNPGNDWHVKGAADFNGDDKADILWQNDDGTPAIWLMNGTSFLSAVIPHATPGSEWRVAGAGDFDGDGKPDILWQNADGTPAIWLMNGTSFASAAIPHGNPGSTWRAVGAADFSGDHKADIIWQNADGTPAIWLMNGTTFVSGQTVHGNPGVDWQIVGA